MNKKAMAASKMRQRFIEKTVEIFGSKGPNGFSASLLSKEVGASKGALYHHFESLDALKLAALQSLVDGFVDIGEQDDQPCPSLEAYLFAVGDDIFEMMEQEPLKMKALMAFIQCAIFDPAFQEKVKELFRHTLDTHAAVVRHLFPALTEEQVAQAVQVVDAFSAGSMIHWYLVNTPEQCRANWKSFCRMFLYSINWEVV